MDGVDGRTGRDPLDQATEDLAGTELDESLRAGRADLPVLVLSQYVEPGYALALLDDPAELDRILAANAGRADAVADATLADVYAHLGFVTGP